MYQGRTLPFAEWERLDQTELKDAWRRLSPCRTRVMVVENAEGQIVQTWMLMTIAHAEGWWTHPDYRKNPAVMGAMWRTMRAAAKEMGIEGVMTAATSPDVSATLEHHGAVYLDAKHYTLRFDVREQRRDLTRGQRFHDQLLAVVPESTHHDDPAHLRAIGAALHRAFHEHEPGAAVLEYNEWAEGAGYATVSLLGFIGTDLVLDMGGAVVAVSSDDSCRLIQQPVEVC